MLDKDKKRLSFSTELLDIYPVGILPPLGYVPQKMYAWTIREERLGSVGEAFAEEIIEVPDIKDNEVIIANVSAGVNYNCIWAAKGYPVNIIAGNGAYDKKEDFHICGSECSAIVYKVGKNVRNVKVGDVVCILANRINDDERRNEDLSEDMVSFESAHVWGYESNWGSYAQFSKVYDYQCLSKPDFMTFEQAACAIATGAVSHKMLFYWNPNVLHKNSVCLVWGGSGGLGSYSIKLAHAIGAKVIAVVSDDEKGKYCLDIGAVGYINRKNYNHWGNISNMSDREYKKAQLSIAKFRNEIFEILGERRLPDIVIEHPGSDTIDTSVTVCAPRGMVVLCGATSGYLASVDLRYLWTKERRIQGSHGITVNSANTFLEYSKEHNIVPDIVRTFEWNELPKAHDYLEKSPNIRGKLVVNIACK